MMLMGDNVVSVAMVTAIIALASQLDGTGVSTFCILIPVMFPVYLRMHMRKTTLLRVAILPIMLGIGQSFGVEVLSIAITMLIIRLSATFICPMTAALLLATGMANVTIMNHIKASALYVWSFAFLCLLFAILIGLVPL